MADYYQKEDASGVYQLEDGSGNYLLEVQGGAVINPLASLIIIAQAAVMPVNAMIVAR